MKNTLKGIFICLFTLCFYLPVTGINPIKLPKLFDSPKVEKERLNGIDFTFKMEDLTIIIDAEFYIESGIDCLMDIAYEFKHKKHYSSPSATLRKGKSGENWYDIHYKIDKFVAKFQTIWRYYSHPETDSISFKLMHYDINMSSFALVKEQMGNYKFIREGNRTKVLYHIEHYLKPTMLKKSLYRIQKNESIELLTMTREYMLKHCKK